MAKIICAAFQKGQRKDGIRRGATLLNKYVNKQTIVLEDSTYPTASSLNKEIYDILQDKSAPHKHIVLGGDHSVAVGSVLSSIRKHDSLGVVWLDAHPDLNTHESSVSKNEHGMPMSIITGLDTEWEWTRKCKHLPFENLLLYGIRDIDDFEKRVISHRNIKSTQSLDDVFIWADKFEHIHLSLDIDGIDPSQCPSTGTPVKNGLSMTDTLDLIKLLKKRDALVGLDIVEFNPEIGTPNDVEKTLNNIHAIIDEAL